MESMRFNGMIRFALPAGEDEYDEDGIPVAGSGNEPQWSQPIPCSIRTVTENRLARYEDGTFHQLAFSVLIEAHAMERSFYHSRVAQMTLGTEQKFILPISTITETPRMGAVTITL